MVFGRLFNIMYFLLNLGKRTHVGMIVDCVLARSYESNQGDLHRVAF